MSSNPTPWAYEQACKAVDYWREMAQGRMEGFSEAELKYLATNPVVINELMGYEDVKYSEAEAMIGPGVGPWPTKRWSELRELGWEIVKEDPDCYPPELVEAFRPR